MTSKPLILFLGNPLFSDDRIGLLLGERLKERLEREGYDVEISEKTGFALLDHLTGRGEAVIVDSVMTERSEVGSIHIIDPGEFRRRTPFTPHYAGLPEALRLMEELNLGRPRKIQIIGIEVKDPYTVSEKLSKELEERFEELVEEVYRRIRELTPSPGQG